MIRKLPGRHLQYGPFKLGCWGILINLFACLYFFILSFATLPSFRPVTAVDMNYVGLLVGAVIAITLGDWLISSCYQFQIIVVLLRPLKIFAQQHQLALVSVSELLLNTDNSPVVSNNAVGKYCLLKSLANLPRSLETLISSRSANVLPFSLLETKYDL